MLKLGPDSSVLPESPKIPTTTTSSSVGNTFASSASPSSVSPAMQLSPPRTPDIRAAAAVTPSTPVVASAEARFLLNAITFICENDREKYGPNDAGEIWHLLTSTPLGFVEKLELLRAELTGYEALLFTGIYKQKYAKVFEENGLYDTILGNNGAACYYSRPGMESLSVFAPNVAQVVLIEKWKEIAIGGKDHTVKCNDKLNSVKKMNDSLNVFQVQIEKMIANNVRSNKLTPENIVSLNKIHRLLEEFREYLVLHAKGIQIALDFNKTDFLASNADRRDLTSPSAVSDFLAQWHPSAPKQATPQKIPQSVQRLNQRQDNFHSAQQLRKRLNSTNSSLGLTPAVTPDSASAASAASAPQLFVPLFSAQSSGSIVKRVQMSADEQAAELTTRPPMNRTLAFDFGSPQVSPLRTSLANMTTAPAPVPAPNFNDADVNSMFVPPVFRHF